MKPLAILCPVLRPGILVSCVLLSSLLFSQIPQTLSYQGVLEDAGGNLVPDGTYQLTFNLYTTFSGGSSLWSETQMVPVADGMFNAILGSMTPLTVAFEVAYWLGVTVGSGAELTPRIPLTSAAYSLNARSVADGAITTGKIAFGAVSLPKISSSGASAGNVLTYNGSNLTWQSPAGGGIGGSGTANYIPFFSSSTTLGNSNMQFGSSWGGSIGIGGSPEGWDSKFLIQYLQYAGGPLPPYLMRFQIRTATIPAIYTDMAYIEGDGDAYFRKRLRVGSATPIDTTAVIYGETDMAGGKAVMGLAAASSGTNYGGFFMTTSTTGRGVMGLAEVSTGANYGVYGMSQSVEGRGVYGVANPGSANINYGVLGSTGNPNGYGVYSSGRFAASGTKSFQIDHPLDPDHKYLNHYCSEGAEPLNAYSGNILLDARGEAWVELPPYFELINKDFRYQLTCIGGFSPVYISQEISDNRFKIAGGQPEMKVSWRVEATRNDRWVEKYGAPVEQDKPGSHRGKYLNPELFGQPETRRVFYQPDRPLPENTGMNQ